MHAELKEQRKLIVDGGNGKSRSGAASGVGGEAGRIIWIISPAGRLPLNVLSLRRGTKVETCRDQRTCIGYYYFVGSNFL